MESDHREWLLNTNQGWAMWSARSAHWRYPCKVKAEASPVLTSYLTTWLRERCEWVGFYSGERRAQWRGFKQSLEQFRDTGVQPDKGKYEYWGIECMVANTHRVLHARGISRQTQLA